MVETILSDRGQIERKLYQYKKILQSKSMYLNIFFSNRMLDMGFLPDITRVMTHSSMPKKGDRRTLMFSATFPDQVQHMAIGKCILSSMFLPHDLLIHFV